MLYNILYIYTGYIGTHIAGWHLRRSTHLPRITPCRLFRFTRQVCMQISRTNGFRVYIVNEEKYEIVVLKFPRDNLANNLCGKRI